MATIHVIYHSDTGNTRKLAELVAEGAKAVEGADVKLVMASQIDYDAAGKADGVSLAPIVAEVQLGGLSKDVCCGAWHGAL